MAGQHCCAKQEWEPVADLGHVSGIDFDLGRCKSCGRYLMSVWWVGPESTYVVVKKQTAERWLKLQGTEELRKRLRRWFDAS